ncbi:hypothetical protein [Actinoplanes sp. NPDC049118]
MSGTRIYCWGHGAYGMLGSASTADLTTPAQVVFPRRDGGR